MDALAVLRRLTGFKPLLCLFIAFCVYPVIAGMVHMITHHAWMMMDIDAVLCGAKTLADGHSPYAIHPPTCAGVKPAAYVYAPQVARLFIPFIQALGIPGTRTLFLIVLLWPATLLLLWYALIKRFPGIDVRWRFLAIASLTSMTFLCANVGLVMHAMVLLSLLVVAKSDTPGKHWPFTIVVLLCACVKPTFLCYFVIFLLDDVPLWKRVFSFVWRCVAGLGVTWLMVLTDGHYGRAWQKTLHSVALTRQPGMGWFELTDIVWRIPTKSLLNYELAGGFMVVMLLAGMAVAQWGKLDRDERLLLGMGLVPLMTPRILDYDMILIAPYAALLMAVAYRIGGGLFKFVVSWTFVAWIVYGILSYILNITAWHRTPMDMFLFGLLTGVVGLRAVAWRLGLRPKEEPEPVTP